jgi:hypothetical protein
MLFAAGLATLRGPPASTVAPFQHAPHRAGARQTDFELIGRLFARSARKTRFARYA